jgi:hypothetical protein
MVKILSRFEPEGRLMDWQASIFPEVWKGCSRSVSSDGSASRLKGALQKRPACLTFYVATEDKRRARAAATTSAEETPWLQLKTAVILPEQRAVSLRLAIARQVDQRSAFVWRCLFFCFTRPPDGRQFTLDRQKRERML